MKALTKKEKIWAAVFLAILALSLLTMVALNHYHRESKIAEIYVHGKLERTIDLNRVTKTERFRLNTGSDGYNIVEVQPGKIRIVEANCRDQICVHQGPIADGLRPIVCLPHQVVIKIRGDGDSPDSSDTGQADIISR